MARRPDMPCAGCGKLMFRGKGMLPEGQARCRDCRKQDDVDHGTRRMYRQRGCRCDVCRGWAAAATRGYNEQRRQATGESYWQSIKPAKVRKRSGGRCSRCDVEIKGSILDDPTCAPCRGNKPGYNIRISASGRLAIYERDGWTCGICFESVDPEASPNSTWGATLDHVVPRSKGGSDDPKNLRLAHRWCNSVRGDLSYYTDDDLRVDELAA